MNVGQIIKSVRWCIDEEASNEAQIANVSAFDFDGGTHTDIGYMNNIIRNSIGAALRWVCLYAPAEQLSGGSSNNGIDIIKEEENLTPTGNLITPAETLVRVIRVRGANWKRSVLGDSLIKEDSAEYLQLSDTFGAQATDVRPQAVLVNTKDKCVEVYPSTGTFTLTYIKALTGTDLIAINNDSTDIGVPPLVETSFVYYLAHLVLSAYGDSRAEQMLNIAKANLGLSEDRQRL